MQAGTRVLALRNVEEKTVYSFGPGTYEGDYPAKALHGLPNPRIHLDTGDYTWGFECWWGSEDECHRRFPPDEFQYVSVKPTYNSSDASKPET